MPKVIRIGRDERPVQCSHAPVFRGAAPLGMREQLGRVRAAAMQRGWLDLALMFGAAITLSAIIVAIGPEVARP